VYKRQDLSRDVEAFRAELLGRKRDPKQIAADVTVMREKIAAAKPSSGWLDIKAGPGRLQDIELLAQTGALLSPHTARDVAGGLAALAQMGWLSTDAARALNELHDVLWQVQLARRLMAPALHDASGLGPSGQEALLRITGQASLEDLQETLDVGHSRADAAILAALNTIGQSG